LTEGKPTLRSVTTISHLGENELLRLAASLEKGSEHPLASAIFSGAKAREIELEEAREFKSTTGGGVQGLVGDHRVALGNPGFLRDIGVDVAPLLSLADELRKGGETVMLVAIDGCASGLVSAADPIRDSAEEATRMLHREGIKVVMLTGDSRTSAEAVA